MKTKIISITILITLLFPNITLAQSGSKFSTTPELDKLEDSFVIGEMPTIKKPEKTKLQKFGSDFGTEGVTKPTLDDSKGSSGGLGLEFDKSEEGVESRKTPDEKAEDICKKDSKVEFGEELSCADYEKRQNEEICKKTSLDVYKTEMNCATYYAQIEKDCQDPSKNKGVKYESCAEKQAALKNRQGAGFKLNLNSLTVTQGSEKDKKRSGSAIFANKDYAKYGVIVGTLLRVTDILIMLIGSLAMLTLVVAGIFMIINHGDEAWVTKGKTMMLYSILGVLFALLSFALVSTIQSALA